MLVYYVRLPCRPLHIKDQLRSGIPCNDQLLSGQVLDESLLSFTRIVYVIILRACREESRHVHALDFENQSPILPCPERGE